MEMLTEGPIKTRREGAILEVTLDRPKANAIDLKTSRVMGLAFRAFRDRGNPGFPHGCPTRPRPHPLLQRLCKISRDYSSHVP